MVDVFKVKDLSPKKKCFKGHIYPEKYDKTCQYCIAKFGRKDESWSYVKRISIKKIWKMFSMWRSNTKKL